MFNYVKTDFYKNAYFKSNPAIKKEDLELYTGLIQFSLTLEH